MKWYSRRTLRGNRLLGMSTVAVAALVACCGCGTVEDIKKTINEGGKRDVSLQLSYHIDREDNLLISDRYRLHLSIYHSEPSAVTGKYIVRAYGDVFGEGGQNNEDGGANYDESAVAVIPPGDAAALKVFYYINDPALREDNLPAETATNAVDMRVDVEFIPSQDDPQYKRTIRKFNAGGGRFTWGQ